MQTQTRSRWAIAMAGVLATVMILFNLSFWKQEDGCAQAQTANQTPKTLIQSLQSLPNPSVATQSLTQALSKGKFVCLFFYEPENADCKTMEMNLDTYGRKNKKDMVIIKVDRKDPSNADIVNTLKAQTASVPLTLLVDPSSAIVAAFTSVLTPEQIVQALPSPKKTETLTYMQQGKGVILCFSSKKMSGCKDIQSCCSQAETKLGGKAEYVNVDLSDPKEANFIKELSVDPNTAVPVTIVINPQGQVTGKYDGAVQTASLVTAATKVVKSGGCCGGGSKSCGPKTTQKK